MVLFKKRKSPKYSSVSVDGTTPVASTVVSEKELSEKKLARAIKNGAKQPKSQKGLESPEKTAIDDRISDSRLKDSIDVIRSFLNFPKDAEFTTEIMVAKFLQLIKDYTELYDRHSSVLKRISDSENRSYGHASFGPSWN